MLGSFAIFISISYRIVTFVSLQIATTDTSVLSGSADGVLIGIKALIYRVIDRRLPIGYGLRRSRRQRGQDLRNLLHGFDALIQTTHDRILGLRSSKYYNQSHVSTEWQYGIDLPA